MAQDRFKYFRIEAREIVDGMSQGLLDLEKRVDAELIARLLRLAHTLKGAARIVGHRELTDLAHAMEDVLQPLREAPAPQRLDGGLALVDQMAVHVAALEQPRTGAPAPPPVAATPRPSAPPPRTAAPAPAAPSPLATAATTAMPVMREPVAPPPRPTDASISRIEPSAVDDLLAGLAEIHALVRQLRGVGDPRVIEARVDQIERELRTVRQDADRLRLVSAGGAFTALERTARDAAHAAGKRVEFAATGGDVRVDAHVLTTLHGALVQLVRNAVAHGIEPPAARAAAGKPPEGQVRITVSLQGNRLAITCEDDGRGIDLDAIRRAAIQRGLDPDRARALQRDELISLMLRGGLSTSAEVTTLSGRGIGLDVVREAAHVLGGEVAVTTSATGTAFRILVPTSLAAITALALSTGDHIATVPLAAVRRVMRGAGRAILRGSEGLVVAFDDVTIPFAPLAGLLGASVERPPRAIVVIDGGNDGLAAIGADRVVGISDVVVRALSAEVPVEPLVWGVALDSEGTPRPVLEPRAVVAAVRGLPPTPAASSATLPPILVIDDSLTTRMLEQSILESAGYEVELACSAEEGMEKVVQRAYGLILVDVEMPGMDGFAFITALRAHPRLSGIPAILVTSRNRPEDLQRGAAVGAQGYVVKGDFDQTKLLDMIRRLVRR